MSDDSYIWLFGISGIVLLLAIIGCGAKYFCGKRRSPDEERDIGPGYNVAMQNRLFKVSNGKKDLWLETKVTSSKLSL